jgi:hypothetical protein
MGWRGVQVGLAAVLLAVGVSGCSGGASSADSPSASASDQGQVTTVAPGVTVEGVGSVIVTSTPEPHAGAALKKAVKVGDRRLPSALAVLATPRRLTASGPLPPSGVVLSFRVSKDRVTAGTTPFLASLDRATGRWVPVPSSYDPTTGVVSARVPHFSTWAPVQWVESRVAAVFEGISSAFFGLGGVGLAPSCSGQSVTVTDSRPGQGIGACAAVSGTDQVAAKIVNERPYAVDLLYPDAAQVTAPTGDAFAELGADLTRLASNWHRQLLLPGGGEADATVAMAPGQQAEFVTQWDNEAYLWGILGTAVDTLATMTGGTAEKLVDALGESSCLSDAVDVASSPDLSLSTAENIGSAAFDCLSAIATGLTATVASIIASLDVELVSSVYSLIDNLTGDASHTLILAAPTATASPSPNSPAGSGTPRITIGGGVIFPLYPIAAYCNNSEPFWVGAQIESNLATTVTYYWSGVLPNGQSVTSASQSLSIVAGNWVEIHHDIQRTGDLNSMGQEVEGYWTLHITGPVKVSATSFEDVYLACCSITQTCR